MPEIIIIKKDVFYAFSDLNSVKVHRHDGVHPTALKQPDNRTWRNSFAASYEHLLFLPAGCMPTSNLCLRRYFHVVLKLSKKPLQRKFESICCAGVSGSLLGWVGGFRNLLSVFTRSHPPAGGSREWKAEQNAVLLMYVMYMSALGSVTNTNTPAEHQLEPPGLVSRDV